MIKHPITKIHTLVFASLIVGTHVRAADQAKISEQSATSTTAAAMVALAATPAGNPAGTTPTTSANTTPVPSPRITLEPIIIPAATQPLRINSLQAVVSDANGKTVRALNTDGQALGACAGLGNSSFSRSGSPTYPQQSESVWP